MRATPESWLDGRARVAPRLGGNAGDIAFGGEDELDSGCDF